LTISSMPSSTAAGRVRGGQLALELLHRARADDRAGDAGVVDDERDRQLDHGQAGVVGDRGELPDGLQLELVLGQRHVEARGELLRAGEVGELSALQLPESQPPASGL
jgi:hypothetical protein